MLGEPQPCEAVQSKSRVPCPMGGFLEPRPIFRRLWAQLSLRDLHFFGDNLGAGWC